jgi:hypothetical protein
MNRLASLAGMAQTSSAQTGQLAGQTANAIGNNQMNAGAARAQGIYGSANAWTNFGNSTAQSLGNMYGNGAFNGGIPSTGVSLSPDQIQAPSTGYSYQSPTINTVPVSY